MPTAVSPRKRVMPNHLHCFLLKLHRPGSVWHHLSTVLWCKRYYRSDRKGSVKDNLVKDWNHFMFRTR